MHDRTTGRVMKVASVVRAKALVDGDAPGTFEALVSVFGNIDSDGDVVARGAFTKTLAAGPTPIVWSHDWLVPPIGETLQASETEEGLLVKGRLFVADDEDHAVARQVYAGMRAGALREFSWGGRVTKETRVEDEDGDVHYEIGEVDLAEYGPCLKGANPATQLLAVKSLVASGKVSKDDAAAAVQDAVEHAADSADQAVEPLGDDSDTNGADVDTDGPQDAPKTPPPGTPDPPADWAQTLAAVEAGVITAAEARARLGLTAVPVADAPDASAGVSAHGSALAELDLAA